MTCEHCTDNEPCPRHEPQDPTGKLVVASVSGGKDSTALSLWLTEQGIEHERVFADTGWEHPATLEYIRDYLPTVLGPITWVKAERQMKDLIRHKGMFPARVVRFCTAELKVKPILAHINEIDPDRKAINAVGIRAGESRARSKLGEWEHDANGFERWVWRPLIDWSEQDVIDMHTRHGIRPNPLYLKGAERVGCWPCIFARKAEVKLVADLTPERIDEIRDLEAEVAEGARDRASAKGSTLEEQGHHEPTFFMRRGPRAGESPMMAIDDVVTWSRTSRGGRQLELFHEPADPGCMRWGLCDSGTPEADE